MFASPIRGVTFDFWNTIVAENPEAWLIRVRAQAGLLADAGIERSDEDLQAAAKRMWEWFHESWHANTPADHLMAGSRLVVELGLADHAEAPRLGEEFADVYRRGSDPATMTIAPGVADALAALSERGVRIGIISDVGFTPSVTLRTYLDHHGLLRYFDGWTFSDEVGEFKPSPTMFTHAAGTLGIDDPAALAHIVDLHRTDVSGALAAGWTAVRYRGLNDDEQAVADVAPVIDHHDELLEVLGLG